VVHPAGVPRPVQAQTHPMGVPKPMPAQPVRSPPFELHTAVLFQNGVQVAPEHHFETLAQLGITHTRIDAAPSIPISLSDSTNTEGVWELGAVSPEHEMWTLEGDVALCTIGTFAPTPGSLNGVPRIIPLISI